jgi:hypothetical protein
MRNGMSRETIIKSLETKKSSIKQIAQFEDTETSIVIDYDIKKLRIYTNRATVMNRLSRMGYEHKDQVMVEEQVYSRSYEFDTKEIGNFLRTSIFKFD